MTAGFGIIYTSTKTDADCVFYSTDTLVSYNRILRAHRAQLVSPHVLVDSVSLTGRFAFNGV